MKIKICALTAISLLFLMFQGLTVDATEQTLLPASIETISGQKWGYIDQSGAFEIQPSYSLTREFNDKGIAIAANGNYDYNICEVYFINRSGQVVSGPFSSYVPDFNNGVAILNMADEGSIVVNDSGKFLFKTKFRVQEYSEGLLSFFDGVSHYGYMDTSGKIVLPAKYLSAESFRGGKAIVEPSPGKYSVIDKSGKVLEVLKFYDKYNSSDGLTSYYDEKSKLYGYKTTDGVLAIPPKFCTADMFIDGFALVSMESENSFNTYGVIDKKGRYVIEPEYSGISYLGSGLFAVSNNKELPYSHYYSTKALFNSSGEKLSDFKFYNIDKFKGDYAAACDNTSTFFINKKGEIVDNLPKLQGIGDIKFIGDIIQAKLDGGLIYLKQNGDILWRKDNTIPLGNGVYMKKVPYRRDYLTFVEYPQISGLKSDTAEKNINQKLKSDYIGNYLAPNNADEEYAEDVTVSFTVSINKNLIIVEKNGYWYPIGAAHGQSIMSYLYADKDSGAFYELKDLFKANSKFTNKLASIVNSQINLNNKISAISGNIYETGSNASVRTDQDFIIGKDSLKVYYSPYEIAPYAAGFPEFEIPYGQISDIVDTKGAFWNSFYKTIVNSKIKLLWDIDSSKVKQIESLLGSYEQNIIKAINNNTFSAVEPYLLKGSSLYNSQKSLVSGLFKKNTKEKLNKYEIYAIEKVNDSELYRVYVLEDIAIKYAGKNYVNKKFSWYYMVSLDKDSKYKLTDIAKW